MKLFTSSQIHDIDRYTIENEPIKSVDLMERAAGRAFEWIVKHYSKGRRFLVFAGPGNNGGDGLVIARMFVMSGYRAEVFYISLTQNESDDWKINRERLKNTGLCTFNLVTTPDQLPMTLKDDIIVDAIFGSGLSRSPSGLAASVIGFINRSECEVISVDMPSGLSGEDPTTSDENTTVKADYTLSFQFPKISFMFPESYQFTGDWKILPIGLSNEAIRKIDSPYMYTGEEDIIPLIKKRNKFDHKGSYGHGLVVAGSRNKAGAAVLAAGAALRSGIGLITCHVPSGCATVIQSSLPEAMVRCDKNKSVVTSITGMDLFTAVAAGPGLGTETETVSAVKKLTEDCTRPLVLDADALNILSLDKKWFTRLNPETILTPHPGEFERLAGKSKSSYDRLMQQISLSVNNNLIIVLKGAHTSVSTPGGKVYFNSTGNPGMATAGSGDVLTGILLALLAQGYNPEDAAVAGVFLHGLAGDLALNKTAQESLIASDIAGNLGNAYNYLKEKRI